MTGQPEPMPAHLGRCPGCDCAASRVRRTGIDYLECGWCGAVHFADGRLSPRRVKVADPARGIPLDASGDVTRTPW